MCLGTKHISFIENSGEAKYKIIIFAGLFDYLAYRMLEIETLFSDFLILNWTSMFFKIEQNLHHNKKVSLFIDNEISGRSVALIIKTKHVNVKTARQTIGDKRI